MLIGFNEQDVSWDDLVSNPATQSVSVAGIEPSYLIRKSSPRSIMTPGGWRRHDSVSISKAAIARDGIDWDLFPGMEDGEVMLDDAG